MANFKFILIYLMVMVPSLVLAKTSEAEIKSQVSDIYDKKTHLLAQIQDNARYQQSLQGKKRHVNRDITKQKNFLESLKKRQQARINQAVFWHYNQKKILSRQLTQSKSFLDGPSLCQYLSWESQKSLNGLKNNLESLQTTLQQIHNQSLEFENLQERDLAYLAQLEEEENVLKNILQDLEQERKRQSSKKQNKNSDESKKIAKASQSLSKNKSVPSKNKSQEFKLASLASPLSEIKKRQASEFLGAKIYPAQKGELIRAVFEGTVIFSDELKGLGKMVIIEHSDGYMSLYANCQEILKQAGESIETNEVIAKVGRSGQIGQEGLYFELRRFGEIVASPPYWLS